MFSSLIESVSFNEKQHCPNVLGHMMEGVWRQKAMSLKETNDIELFWDDSRKQHGLNVTLQRNDSKCGNVSFPHKTGSKMQWFRGLCDRKGNTPCCFNNQCVNRSPDQCRCKDCYDMRQQIHAEYSDFISKDQRCQIKQFNYIEACDLLTNATLAFVGDSYVRHIFTAVLLLLRNNYVDGALSQNVKKG
ncbi:hypothetical protein LOTGIDRAFT_153351 [Lottia gigantea]|uniref:Uncharacterized protein n=1 Tax=Lottia gigantea TaxID=225164 RepID=V4AAS9_LOTGI|nr:hypothetical protein LOTGIDRAFT_153351 [Lottia gigantea]ESO93877.1 hypothetical protein LOTGIDRAFT_153351 [Lottia gigantea]